LISPLLEVPISLSHIFSLAVYSRAWLLGFMHPQGFNFFQMYQYFTIYRQYFFLKNEHFSWISYTTFFEIRRYQLPF
jgi:hypothetical protein